MTIAARLALITGTLCCLLRAGSAEEPPASALDRLQKSIVTRSPSNRVAKVDRERLTVRRIDVVDQSGVIRMTIASPTPPPIIDGIQYQRRFPVTGLTIYDRDGSERGGYGVADIEGSAVVNAQDHANTDAVGWRVNPDGSVELLMNQRPPLVREPALGGHLRPALAGETASRIRLTVAADGAPAIALADAHDRPRLRLTVTEEGYGAIEFLDAEGRVVERLAPEAHRVP